MVSEKNVDLDPPDFACEVDSLISTMNEIITSDSIMHVEAKKYVAGYVIKKCNTIFKNYQSCMDQCQI